MPGGFWPVSLAKLVSSRFNETLFKKKNNKMEAGEMIQQLRALDALSVDLCSIPSIHMEAQDCLTLILGNPVSSLNLHGYQACMQCTHIVDKTPPHINKIVIKSKIERDCGPLIHIQAYLFTHTCVHTHESNMYTHSCMHYFLKLPAWSLKHYLTWQIK